MFVVSVILAVAVLLLIIVAASSRINGKRGRFKGIGSKFIRFTVVSTSIPVVGILALNHIIPGEAATGIIGAALGYAFGLRENTQTQQ